MSRHPFLVISSLAYQTVTAFLHLFLQKFFEYAKCIFNSAIVLNYNQKRFVKPFSLLLGIKTGYIRRVLNIFHRVFHTRKGKSFTPIYRQKLINSHNKLPGIYTGHRGTRFYVIIIQSEMKAGERSPAKTQNSAFLPNDLTKHMNLNNIFYNRERPAFVSKKNPRKSVWLKISAIKC